MADRILIVDDEAAITDVLEPVLAAQGYLVKVAHTALACLELAAHQRFDVVLLDLGLPDIDGKDIISQLKKFHNSAILVVSARMQETEKVEALDIGADDFIEKPFGIEELLARVRVAVRRRNNTINQQTVFSSKELLIDFASHQVSFHGTPLKFSPKEYALLETLAKSAGQVVTHRRLLIAGWQDVSVDSQYLRTYIGLLRQKLEADPAEPSLIITVPGVGYRMAL